MPLSIVTHVCDSTYVPVRTLERAGRGPSDETKKNTSFSLFSEPPEKGWRKFSFLLLSYALTPTISQGRGVYYNSWRTVRGFAARFLHANFQPATRPLREFRSAHFRMLFVHSPKTRLVSKPLLSLVCSWLCLFRRFCYRRIPWRRMKSWLIHSTQAQPAEPETPTSAIRSRRVFVRFKKNRAFEGPPSRPFRTPTINSNKQIRSRFVGPSRIAEQIRVTWIDFESSDLVEAAHGSHAPADTSGQSPRCKPDDVLYAEPTTYRILMQTQRSSVRINCTPDEDRRAAKSGTYDASKNIVSRRR